MDTHTFQYKNTEGSDNQKNSRVVNTGNEEQNRVREEYTHSTYLSYNAQKKH